MSYECRLGGPSRDLSMNMSTVQTEQQPSTSTQTTSR